MEQLSYEEPSQPPVSRRTFLKTAGVVAAGALAVAAVPVKSEVHAAPAESAGIFSVEQVRKYEAFVNELVQTHAPSVRAIPSEIRNTNPAVLPDFAQIPEMSTIRSHIDPRQRALELTLLLGVETIEQISGNIPEEVQAAASEFDSQIAVLQNKYSDYLANPDLTTEAWEDYNKTAALLTYTIYQKNMLIGNPRYDFKYFDTSTMETHNANTCNIYSTDWFQAIGLGDRISHRVDEQGNPVKAGGKELSAYGMLKWMETKSSQFGWREVTEFTYAQKQALLDAGYAFYGANGEHTYVICGIKAPDGVTIPVLTQSTDNILMQFLPPGAPKIGDYMGEGAYHQYAIKLPEILPKEKWTHPMDSIYYHQGFNGECGPACIAMVRATYESGISVSQMSKEACEALGVEKGIFANITPMQRYMKSLGYETHFDFNYIDAANLKRHFDRNKNPLIVNINSDYGNGEANHFVVVRGITRSGKVFVHDPLRNIYDDELPAGVTAYGKALLVTEDAWKRATATPQKGSIGRGQAIVVDTVPENKLSTKRYSAE